VAVGPPEEAETATKPSPARHHKHSLGGCTIDMPPSNRHRRQGHVVSPRDTYLLFKSVVQTSQTAARAAAVRRRSDKRLQRLGEVMRRRRRTSRCG